MGSPTHLLELASRKLSAHILARGERGGTRTIGIAVEGLEREGTSAGRYVVLLGLEVFQYQVKMMDVWLSCWTIDHGICVMINGSWEHLQANIEVHSDEQSASLLMVIVCKSKHDSGCEDLQR